MKILITSGGTDVPIDDVRKITNMSSGRYGAKIAEAFSEIYSRTQDISENAHRIWYLGKKDGVFPNYSNRKVIINNEFSNFDEYKSKSIAFVEHVNPDIIISAAAVSDYILDKTEGKISSDSDELVIRLKKAPKVLPLLREAAPNALLVGFKLLVNASATEAYAAISKVFKSGADLVIYNDLAEIRRGNTDRLVFTPEMNFENARTASQLVDIILKHKKQ